MKNVRHWLVGSLVVLGTLLLLSGCGPFGKPSVDDIVAHIQQAQKATQRVHAVMDTTFTIQADNKPMTTTMVMEEWVAGPDKLRMEYKDGPAATKGMLMVMNGNTMWTYFPKTNQYMKSDISGLKDLTQASGGDMALQTKKMVTQMLDTMDFKYLGTEKVAGRKAYKLLATPKPGKKPEAGLLGGSATVWIDAQYWEVLGMESKIKNQGSFSFHYRSIEYNPTLPDSLFTFTPPPGAKAMTEENGGPQFKTMTLAEARKAVDFPILVPTKLPDGIKLQTVEVTTMKIMNGQKTMTNVILMYSAGLKGLSINESRLPKGASVDVMKDMPPGVKAEKVKVHGQDAVLINTGMGNIMLSWTEKDVQIIVNSQMDKKTLLQIAESMQ